jgi:hypothetical protein
VDFPLQCHVLGVAEEVTKFLPAVSDSVMQEMLQKSYKKFLPV